VRALGLVAAQVQAMAAAADPASAPDRALALEQAPALEQASARAEMESETYPTHRRRKSGPPRSRRQSRI